MLGTNRDRLCAEAAHWYKMWSTWLAVGWGIITATFWNDPTLFGAIANAFPANIRAGMTPLVFALTTVLPIMVRLLKQRKVSGA